MTASSQKTLLSVQAFDTCCGGCRLIPRPLHASSQWRLFTIHYRYWGAGVDLFFIISGFIMFHTTSETFCQPNASRSFIRRRVIRIVPLYWLYTTGVVLLLAFAPRLFASTQFDWLNVISSYFFLLSKNSAGQIGTVMQTGWTLCFELYFYLLFAILLNFPRKYFLILIGAIF